MFRKFLFSCCVIWRIVWLFSLVTSHDISSSLHDVWIMSKCAGNAVWGLSSTFTSAIIHYLLQSLSWSKNEFRIVFHVSTWSNLLRTLIPWGFCRSDSIPSRTFLCFYPLSCYDLCVSPVNTTLALHLSDFFRWCLLLTITITITMTMTMTMLMAMITYK